MILTCTSKGNTLPNGLPLGSASPLYFVLAKQSMNVDSPLWSVLLIQIHGPIVYSCQDLFSMDEKSVHVGGTAYSVLSATWSPRDSSPPINSLGWLSKTRRAPILSLIPHCPAKLFSHHGADVREACFDNRASCCSFGPVKSGLASPVKEDLSKHPVQTQLYHWVDQLVPDAPLRWPCGSPVGLWNESPWNGR